MSVQQTFVRVYSGVLESGMQVLNSNNGKNRAYRPYSADSRERPRRADPCGAGEIVALIGMKDTKTVIPCVDPVHSPGTGKDSRTAVSYRDESFYMTKKDEEKMGFALNRLMTEDPSFQVRVDEESNETIIAGMGELHLEIMVDRLKEEFGVEVKVGEPSVAYREAMRRECEQEVKFVKQTGGKGMYAHAVIRFEPNPGKGFEFVDQIKGGAIPNEYIPSCRKGIEAMLDDGILAGYPILDVKAVLLDGSYHNVDSSDMAFRICAGMCFKQAFMKADPVILEPVMKIEVNTPDDYIGDVIGDLNRRRGKIAEMRRFRKGSQKVDGSVPLMEMFGYATQLRSLSSGRANYSMEFSHYEQVPREVQEKVVKAAQERREARNK